jgi:hypothetical protein
MTIKPTKTGKEIEENLNNVNLDPWYYIYENYIKDESKEKLEQTEKEQDSSD